MLDWKHRSCYSAGLTQCYYGLGREEEQSHPFRYERNELSNVSAISTIWHTQLGNSEMYSAIEAEVPIISDPATKVDPKLVESLKKADKVRFYFSDDIF